MSLNYVKRDQINDAGLQEMSDQSSIVKKKKKGGDDGNISKCYQVTLLSVVHMVG